MHDSHKTLTTAERNVRSAVDEAFAAYLRDVKRSVLGSLRADASPADLPPNLDFWPDSSVWAELARRWILPAIAAAFGLAFDTAARADVLQSHRHQQTFMDEVFDRLSRSLWPETAFEMVRGDLAEGLDAGESVPQLRDRVAAALDVDRYSYLAERIARTESHTATEGGTWSAHMAWAEVSGEELFKLWDATRDSRTRLTHRVANNQIVALADSFTVGGASLLYPGDPSAPPQESINCFPGDVSVTVPGGQPVAIFRRWYEGPLYKVRTKNGLELAGTPNHPLLSEGGWVALQNVEVGDQLVRPGSAEGVSGSNPQVADAPTRLDELYRAAHETGMVYRVPSARVDFHGDLSDSDVDVVRPLGHLPLDEKSPSAQSVNDGVLGWLDGGPRAVPGQRSLLGGHESVSGTDVFGFPVADRSGATRGTAGFVRRASQVGAFGKRESLHPQPIRLAHGAQSTPRIGDAFGDPGAGQSELSAQGKDRGTFVIPAKQSGNVNVSSQSGFGRDVGRTFSEVSDSAFSEPMPDDVTANPVSPSDVHAALPGLVALDEVIDIQIVDFAGHVYNLESPSGWYTANSIVASNCRCSTLVGSREEMVDFAGLTPEDPPVETPTERVERILAEAVTGSEAVAQVFSAADLMTSQKAAFKRYTGSAYRNMNKAVRTMAAEHAPQVITKKQGRNPTRAELDEWDRLLGQAPTADQLISAGVYGSYDIDTGTPSKDALAFAGMHKAFTAADQIKAPVKLYRGVGDLGLVLGRDHDLVGLEFADAAVVSTSTDEDVAQGFGSGGAIMEVLADAGTPAISVAAISQYPEEEEIIFPQGTRFRVVSDEDRDGRRYLQVEPVGAPGWKPIPRTKTATTAAAGAPEPGGSGSLPTRACSSPTTPSWSLRPPTTVTAAQVGATSNPGGPVTDTVAEPTDPEAPTERLFWRAAMVPLDTRADYRIITSPEGGQVKKTSLSYLKWQERTGPGHDNAVAIGRADRVWIQDGWLWGEGEWDLKDPEALKVIDKIERDFAGTLSVDLRDGWAEEIIVDADGNVIAFEDLPEDFDELYEMFNSGQYRCMERIHDWRFEGVTLVQSPAYYTSRIWIVRPEKGALTAAATGQSSLPLADRDREWDGDAAKRRLADAGRLNAGCFWRTDEADPDSDIQADYKLPFADIIDDELVAVPAGIFSVAGVLQGAMGGVDIPEGDKDTIRDRVEDYYEDMAKAWDDPEVKAPWENDDEEDDDDGEAALKASADVAVLTAAAGIATETTTWAEQVAANVPLEPPTDWFTDPGLTGPTKVRVTDHGRVYGHIATWDTNHVGFPGQSVRPPQSATDYAHYRRNRVRCADGTQVWTGALVMGTGHADTRVSSASAMAHYDDTGYNVADVVCGEDEIGIWFSGCLRPGSSPLQVLTLDRYSVSGDWRGGELVGVCVVNVPGFPISENELSLVAAASGGGALPTAQLKARYEGTTPVALVASGVLAPTRTTTAAATASERAELARIHQRLDQIPDQVYAATRRARREDAEFARLSRQMRADAVEAMAIEMGVS